MKVTIINNDTKHSVLVNGDSVEPGQSVEFEFEATKHLAFYKEPLKHPLTQQIEVEQPAAGKPDGGGASDSAPAA